MNTLGQPLRNRITPFCHRTRVSVLHGHFPALSKAKLIKRSQYSFKMISTHNGSCQQHTFMHTFRVLTRLLRHDAHCAP